MSPSIEAVLGKARAFVDGLIRIPRSARSMIPQGHFARDYNILRKLALEAAPALDERLLGKYVAVYQDADAELSRASYAEIEVYARQIIEQLMLLRTSPPPGLQTPAAPDDAIAPEKAYDVELIRQQHEHAYAPWSKEDDRHLRLQFLAGSKLDELSQEFGRKPSAIRSRLRRRRPPAASHLGRPTV